jgi:hypothetical protein
LSSRKKVTFIVILLILTLAVFAYVRKEIFYQKIQKLVEEDLKKYLPCEFSVEKIRAGLWHGLVLENVKISFPQNNIGLDLNIKIGKASVPGQNLTSRELVLILDNGQIFLGESVSLLRHLQGRLLLNQKGLYFQDIRATIQGNPRDTIKLHGQFAPEKLTATLNLEHLKINGFDILTNLALTMNKQASSLPDSAKVWGTLKSYGSVLNNRPFPELNSSFEIQDERLRIFSLTLGDNYDLRGIVDLNSLQADLSLNFHQAAAHELVAQWSDEPNFSGLINGLIKITGELRQPKIEGYLETKQGHIGDLHFVSADINIKGEYPRIAITDSRICREEECFVMEGEIDFTNLLEERSFKDVRFKAERGILWQGWDISRRRDNQVHMSKSLDDDLKITFDTFVEEEAAGFGDNYINEIGLEYRIFGDKLLRVRLREEEGILGLERRIKF